MKIKEIISAIEEFAPLSLQESYDNAGLIVGSHEADVESALLCVDITEEVLAEAVERGCGLIISHHPIVFSPLKRITDQTYIERVVTGAIKHNIALYASHTNLDSAADGMSWRLAEQLGVENCCVLAPSANSEVGFGVVGELATECNTAEFLRRVQQQLGTGAIRHNTICSETVRMVAICTGAGGSLIDNAVAAGAQVYISADFRYNNFLDAEGRIVIADVGHFESEYCAIDLIFDIITKKIPTFALCKSAQGRNPINYLTLRNL